MKKSTFEVLFVLELAGGEPRLGALAQDWRFRIQGMRYQVRQAALSFSANKFQVDGHEFEDFIGQGLELCDAVVPRFEAVHLEVRPSHHAEVAPLLGCRMEGSFFIHFTYQRFEGRLTVLQLSPNTV